MSDLERQALLTKVNDVNRQRINWIIGVFFIVHLVHILVFWPSAAADPWRTGVIRVHSAMLVFLLVLLPTKLLLERHEQKGRLLLNLVPAVGGMVYLLGGAALAIVDQRVTTSINAMMIAFVGVPLVIILRPFVALTQYVAALLFFLVGVGWIQQNQNLLLTARVNAMTAAGLGFTLALLQWRNQMQSLRQQERIQAQQRELEAKNRELTVLATHDSLTGLLNRAQFDREVAVVLSAMERTGSTACLVLLDVDYFKRINDTHGHPVGDQVLIEVAGLLSASLRPVDIVGRLGGEEFVILMPGLTLSEGVTAAERLRKLIGEEPFMIGGQPIRLAASFGVAALQAGKDGLAHSYRAADMALYQAKNEGRNCVRAFDPAVALGQAAFSVQPPEVD